jgi:hypothetical protein
VPKVRMQIFGWVGGACIIMGAALLNSHPKPVRLAWGLILGGLILGLETLRLGVIHHKYSPRSIRKLPDWVVNTLSGICLFGVLCIYVFAIWQEQPTGIDKPRPPEEFSAVCRTWLECSSRITTINDSPLLMLLFIADKQPSPPTALPIGGAIYVQFTNLRSISRMIDAYVVEAETRNGKRQALVPIDIEHGTTFLVPPNYGLTNATRVEFNRFRVGKAMSAGEVVQGGCFLTERLESIAISASKTLPGVYLKSRFTLRKLRCCINLSLSQTKMWREASTLWKPARIFR